MRAAAAGRERGTPLSRQPSGRVRARPGSVRPTFYGARSTRSRRRRRSQTAVVVVTAVDDVDNRIRRRAVVPAASVRRRRSHVRTQSSQVKGLRTARGSPKHSRGRQLRRSRGRDARETERSREPVEHVSHAVARESSGGRDRCDG